MSLKIDIQKQIMQNMQGGTFNEVTYDTDHLPVEGSLKTPQSVTCNELSGGISNSSSFGATGTPPVLRDWRFEATAEFTCEADVSYFLQNELSLNFNLDNLSVSVVPSGDFQVTHPTRNASHNGTKLTVGLTVNTRR